MPKKIYTLIQTKIILLILQGNKNFAVILSENILNPNMVRKQKCLQNIHFDFGEDSEHQTIREKPT